MKRVLMLSSFVLLLPVLSPAAAFAQQPKSDQAAATALFYDARTQMQKGNFAAACPKLEESLRLDYGIGTEFNLADCNEHLGKTATAWSGFLNVAAAAKAANQGAREKVARERARALEARLPKMIIEVPAPPAGIEVKRDGVVVGAAAWGTAVPVDPGAHKILVTATGKERWETTVSASDNNTTRVTVPRDLPNAAMAAAPVQTTKPATVAPVTPAVTAPATPVRENENPPQESFPEPVVEHSNPQRTVGWVVAGAGLVGLGVGAGFGINALQKRSQSNSHCNGDLCDGTGVKLRDDSIKSGNISTITSIGGGVALVGGIILLATAPNNEERKATTAKKVVPSVNVAANGGGISLEGVFQ